MVTSQPATTPPDRGRSRPQAVAETIKEWMVQRGLKPGDRLPGEQELIRHFGAAKGTIREALKILEAQGLLRSRTGPGGGLFVHAVSEARARALLGNYFFFRDLSIADIYQLRRALEPELAADLAGRVSKFDLARLEASMAPYAEPARTIAEGEAQRIAELEFHDILASLTDNPLLGFQCRFLVNLLKDLAVCRKIYRRRIPDLRRKGRYYQHRLLDALKSGDADAARTIMQEHMALAQRVMERQEAIVRQCFLSE